MTGRVPIWADSERNPHAQRMKAGCGWGGGAKGGVKNSRMELQKARKLETQKIERTDRKHKYIAEAKVLSSRPGTMEELNLSCRLTSMMATDYLPSNHHEKLGQMGDEGRDDGVNSTFCRLAER